MKKKHTIKILILLLSISCNAQKDIVRLEMGTDKDKEYYTYYIKNSDKPYSGNYISKSANDNVSIDFKNGKMDGKFIRLNNLGDTTEYILYENGRKKTQIDFLYEDGKLIWRNEIKNIKGSKEDKRIFDKVTSYIMSNDFYGLDDFLNPLFKGQYKIEFNSLANQFGELKGIEIKEIRKKIDTYKKREDITAKIIFNYENIQLNSSFLIVKETNGKLKGQAFTIRPISYELLPDNKIDEVIDILNNKEVNKFLSIKHLDLKYKKEVKEYLTSFGKISSTYKYLNTELLVGDKVIFLKNYLVRIDGKKQILTLKYNAISKDVLDLRLFYFSEYRSPFEVMHF